MRRRSYAGETARQRAPNLYAADAAEGMVLAAERYDGADPVNLGTAEEVSIRDLVETIAHLCRYEGKVRWDTSQPNGQPRRGLDTSRAELCFGFRAKTPLTDGLAATVEWYLRRSAATP